MIRNFLSFGNEWNNNHFGESARKKHEEEVIDAVMTCGILWPQPSSPLYLFSSPFLPPPLHLYNSPIPSLSFPLSLVWSTPIPTTPLPPIPLLQPYLFSPKSLAPSFLSSLFPYYLFPDAPLPLLLQVPYSYPSLFPKPLHLHLLNSPNPVSFSPQASSAPLLPFLGLFFFSLSLCNSPVAYFPLNSSTPSLDRPMSTKVHGKFFNITIIVHFKAAHFPGCWVEDLVRIKVTWLMLCRD